MAKLIKVGIVGLDTSHSIEFTRIMQAPDCPREDKVRGMRVVACTRFETPFQDAAGLDQRQEQMEEWGVRVTESVKETVEGVDAIMIEINDPAPHLKYFKQVAALGKPVFIDKPLAGTVRDGRAILRLAKEHKTRVMSGSSLRFCRELLDGLKQVGDPDWVNVHGMLGTAPTGDSLVWYGVHAFEMLERAMGPGARRVTAHETGSGVVSVVEYDGGRQGVVETQRRNYAYGGRLQVGGTAVPFLNTRGPYPPQVAAMRRFFAGGEPEGTLENAFEVLAMMVAARKSIETGRPAPVPKGIA
tara:strand:- start:1864 stop:2763 length:900 start_codon:yes stop_codon:yes gene_type:complete